MPDGFTSYTSRIMTHLLLDSLGILCLLFELSALSTNVSSGGTIQVLALLRWTLSVRNCHPIVLNGDCHRWHCLCLCCTLHRCSAWTIPCNVPHHMACAALLSIPAATRMHLIFWTAIITLTAAITGLLGHPRVIWIPLLTLRLRFREYSCHHRVVFLL